SAADSLTTMRIEPGFRIEAFVVEPAIASPVAMEFDERGRLFVVEMPGYPLDTRPNGRVKLLEDLDHDGRYERSTMFADGLVLPTGVMRWKRGILVTAAPDVWYFEDRDGDGRADIKKVVLTGFAFTNPQHTVNGPVYGLDNWIYLAHEGPAEAIVFKDKFGDQGSGVRFPDQSEVAPLDVNGRGVRFRPERHAVEALAGHSQFGHAFDEWGHYFTLDNSNHARHEVIAARYLERNPDLLLRSAMRDASDHGAAATVYPITRHAEFEMLSEPGQFTSACSLTFVPGGPLAAALGRSSFVAEPVHNLVHRDVWSPAGASFVARRAQEGREFLAAADPWFRPVNFAAGPDGALYLVDYYRPLIEHPEWGVAHHHHDSPALYRGSDRGRIYRISAESQGPVVPGRLPGEASTQELVGMLAHPNQWWRRTAQRLLVDLQPPEARDLLLRLFHQGPSAVGRLHALWTLEGLGKLEPTVVREALGDPEPGVRENAVRLAETFLNDDRPLAERLLAMVGDPDPRVRFQLLCTLGGLDSPAARAARDRLLSADVEDEWMQVAALSSSSNEAVADLDRALRLSTGRSAVEGRGRAAFLRQAAAVVGARRRPAEIGRLVDRMAAPGPEWLRTAVLEGLAQGLGRTHTDGSVLAGVRARLLAMSEGPSPAVRHAALALLAQSGLPEGPGARSALERATARAADEAQAPAARADAVGLLALAEPERQVGLLQGLVDPKEPEPVQVAAVNALGRIPGEAVGTFLIEHWRALTPTVRAEAAEALLRDPVRTKLLLHALKDGRVAGWTLGFWHKRDLLMHDDPAVRAEAHALLEERPGERQQLLKRYEAALDGPSDAARGEQVFRAVCAKCHRFQGLGAEVGPDLGTVRNRPASLLLKDVLMPSLSIAQGYEGYVVERASGGIEQGVLAGQTPTTIVLHREGGEEVVIPRADVRRMYVSELSAMPADLEQQVSEAQMADLLQYLTRAR
ncbi:MAG TPA: PVC-type heme-binding CxxCH protein, partial [Acidimicrobiales bacterium]